MFVPFPAIAELGARAKLGCFTGFAHICRTDARVPSDSLLPVSQGLWSHHTVLCAWDLPSQWACVTVIKELA